uniref:Uncharacterized protein n=1 Tax=Panagrolaimus superbus TaxID=310955 RepID=A0A914Y2I9_9BILA
MDRWDRPTYQIVKSTNDAVIIDLSAPPYTLRPFSSPYMSTEIMVVNMERALSYAITTKYEYANFDLIEINNVLADHKAATRCKFYFGPDVMNRFQKIDIDKRVWKQFLLPVDEVIVEGEIGFSFLEMFMKLLNAPSTFICRSVSFPVTDRLIFRDLPSLPALAELHFNYRATQKTNLVSNLVDLRDNYREQRSLNIFEFIVWFIIIVWPSFF